MYTNCFTLSLLEKNQSVNNGLVINVSMETLNLVKTDLFWKYEQKGYLVKV